MPFSAWHEWDEAADDGSCFHPATVLSGDVIENRPMSCGMSVEQYCTLSALKIVVAKFHLAEFERLAQAGSRFSLTIDPEYAYAPLHGHADGAVFEAFAAFDAFSCAIAHKLNFKGPTDSQ